MCITISHSFFACSFFKPSFAFYFVHRSELTLFTTWLDKARHSLEERERSLAQLNKMDASSESTREFVSDVIAHQADLRFITMAAQKFVDESKVSIAILLDHVHHLLLSI